MHNAQWQTYTLSEIADPDDKWSITGGPFGSDLKQESYTSKGIRIIQLQNIGDGVFNDKYKIFTSPEKAASLLSANIYPGEIILSKMGDPVARACIIPATDDRYLMSSDGIRLKPDASRFNTRYIEMVINHPSFRNSALKASTGSTRKRISLETLKKLRLSIPSLEEQNNTMKLVDTFSTYISTLDKKILIKRILKITLAEKLLSGELRLPGFGGEWLSVSLDDISKIKRGGSPRPINDYITNSQNGLNWLRIGDIETGSRYIRHTKQKIKPEGLNKTTMVHEGDFILSNSMSFGRPYIMKISACIHDGWLALMDIKPSVNKSFLYYMLSSSKIQNKFTSLSAGSGVQNLKKETVGTVKIQLPDIEEQIMIAKLLHDADDEIELLIKKREIVVAQKKYLIDNLISGNIRVPDSMLIEQKETAYA